MQVLHASIITYGMKVIQVENRIKKDVKYKEGRHNLPDIMILHDKVIMEKNMIT